MLVITNHGQDFVFFLVSDLGLAESRPTGAPASIAGSGAWGTRDANGTPHSLLQRPAPRVPPLWRNMQISPTS